MPPMNADQLRQYLEFYRDLGVKDLYRSARPQSDAKKEPDAQNGKTLAPGARPPVIEPVAQPAIQPVKEIELPSLAPTGDSLFKILDDIGDCRRCRLHEGRQKIVFGVGNEHAQLVFVGEGPGADEEEQGIPFVGRAGQLLTQMIENT